MTCLVNGVESLSLHTAQYSAILDVMKFLLIPTALDRATDYHRPPNKTSSPYFHIERRRTTNQSIDHQ